MDLAQTILVAATVGFALPVFIVLAKSLILFLLNVIIVSEQSQVSTLDRYLSESGWCSSRRLGSGNLPGDGVHFTFAGGHFAVVIRSTENLNNRSVEKYHIYAFGSATYLVTTLSGNPRDI